MHHSSSESELSCFVCLSTTHIYLNSVSAVDLLDFFMLFEDFPLLLLDLLASFLLLLLEDLSLFFLDFLDLELFSSKSDSLPF